MALKTLVKVSTVTNLSDARYGAGMGVEMLGFNLNPATPGYLDAATYNELGEWIAGIKYVGEVHEMTSTRIKDQLKHYQVDLLEYSNIDLRDELITLSLPLIFRINLQDTAVTALEGIMEDLQKDTEFFLLEGNTDDDGLDIISELATKFDIILGLDLDADEMIDWVENEEIHGIALRGGDEIRPGYKDYDTLADILEAIESED